MVLDVDRQDALAGLERNTLRDRPRGQRTVALEPEVVVKPACVVALHHEHRVTGAAALRAERLGRLRTVALALVVAELVGHPVSLPVENVAGKTGFRVSAPYTYP
jgi:hypothetical protein